MSAPTTACGVRRPGWTDGPAIGRHRLPCVLPAGHGPRHRDALGETWQEPVVTVHTCDHGPVTLPEPAWCTGRHEDGLHLVDLSHDGPETLLTVGTERGDVELMRLFLTRSPHSGRPEDRRTSLVVEIGSECHRFREESALRMLAAELVVRAGRVRDLAAELTAVQDAESAL
ncbi:hypothetical protein OG689_19570 [Kitasatospora sp. NBC_00240]|uniref:DUF6907 domain-containing protein n=1 Tax=Kitasatospora sp. NBC_00240 TaxID=2903567 RepID=UPI0022584E2C|nr:hypothetical protein [Kitasatospora sp. NBC_00240]MCX5211461.1 hypothetical protein [Kitasatospora sp. NBC_00240]